MTPAIDLRPDHRRIVEEILREHLPNDVRVWVFGSRAEWTTKDSSDLDLALERDGPLDSRFVMALDLAFEESLLPFGVDVVDLHRVDEGFRQIVLRGGAVLVEGGRRVTRPDWVCRRLGDISLKIGSGATPRGGKAVYLDDGPCSLIRSQNVLNNRFSWDGLAFIDQTRADALRNAEVFPEDVLLNITGDSVARACQVDPEALPARVNQHVAILRPDPDKLNPRFLRYFLVSPKMQTKLLSWAGSGGTRKALTKGMIESFEVPAPQDVREQGAIARLLGELDDRIELNRRMSETVDAMARAIFRSWFVDFDPVRAKIEGRDPRLPPGIHDLFPDRLVDSELGEIPEGWDVAPLDTIAVFRNGLALQKFRPTDAEDWLPVLKIAQLRRGATDGIERARASIAPDFIVGDGDIVFSWSGSLELRLWTGGPAALNQHLFKVSSGSHPRWFVFRSVESHLREFRAIAEGKATTMGHIKREHLREALCVVPHRDLLDAVSSVFERLDKITIRQSISSRELDALRDTLLPKLVSGDVRLPAVLVSEAA